MPDPIQEPPIVEPLEIEAIDVSGLEVTKIDKTPIVLENTDYALIAVLNKLSAAIENLRIAIISK